MHLENKRIITIDLLRGYFLFVIIIDHLARFPGLYDIFTGQGRLWASAAEGFFLLSGMMVGLVRGKQLIKHGFKQILLKLWKRSLVLYIFAVILTFIFATWAVYLQNPNIQIGIDKGELFSWPLMREVLLLNYKYGWSDFLPYYTVFIFLSPFALLALKYKQWLAVAVVSLYLWYIGLTSNFYLSWQLLFFTGIIIGFNYYHIESWFKSIPKAPLLKKALIISSAITLTLSFITVHAFTRGLMTDYISHLVAFFSQNSYSDAYIYVFSIVESYYQKTLVFFHKDNLAPGRVIIFFQWFMALYILFRRYEHTILRFFGWFLVPMGQNSLTVYIMHAFFVFIASLLIPLQTPALDIKLITTNTALNTFVLVAIWYLVTNFNSFKLKLYRSRKS
jgi:hypothetical protein